MLLMRIPLTLSVIALAFTGSTAAGCPAIGSANTHPNFDATLLKEGRFTYRTTLKGESLGDTVIEVRRVGSMYRMTMSAIEIGQAWEATVESSFAPVSTHLEMQSRGAPYEMNLKYDVVQITGAELKGGVATPVRSIATGVVIDQRVDWASMMAVQAPLGGAVTMSVFDPPTQFSQLLGKVSVAPVMTGAWGTAAALRLDYSICHPDHVENYTVFATRSTPRYMLREDMPGGLVSELIRVEP